MHAHTPIRKFADNVGKRITIHGWLMNKRGTAGVLFLVVRDGSGICQCVVEHEHVNDETFHSRRCPRAGIGPHHIRGGPRGAALPGGV